MATNITEEIVSSFVGDPDIGALALFGAWGTGKTYLVQRFFKTKEATELMAPQKLRYAYVSLYGLESLAEVRKRIFLSGVGGRFGGLLGTADKIRKGVSRSATVAGVALDLTSIGDVASDFIQERSLKNLVICIDDLERCGKNLAIHDVCGLIAEFTESRNSKCIVLFNREKLREDDVRKLDEQNEKIFDLSIEYRPSVAENLGIGFQDAADRKLAQQAFEEFGNANIRIMKRVCWALRAVRNSNAKHLDEIWPSVVQHVAVLTILKHAHSEVVPDLREIMKGTSDAMRIFDKEQGDGKLPERIRGILDELHFEGDQFDDSLITLLTTGKLVIANFTKEVEEAYNVSVRPVSSEGVLEQHAV
jgi:hypothetical protein